MEIKVVIEGIEYRFERYSDLCLLLEESASVVSESMDDTGVYFLYC